MALLLVLNKDGKMRAKMEVPLSLGVLETIWILKYYDWKATQTLWKPFSVFSGETYNRTWRYASGRTDLGLQLLFRCLKGVIDNIQLLYVFLQFAA